MDSYNAFARHRLAVCLQLIKANDLPTPDYDQRNKYILQSLGYAIDCEMGCGIRIDPNDEDGCVVYIIDNDVGEMSWHIPCSTICDVPYSNDEKYKRVVKFIETNIDHEYEYE